MRKSELVREIALKVEDLTIREVDDLVTSVFDEISDALARGDRVELRNFGTFSVRDRGPRAARNPRTGETVQVGAKRVPHFKPGKRLLEDLNG